MITVTRIDTAGMAHRVEVRGHSLIVDLQPAAGGADAGPDPHDLYDSALGACKALTMLWYAQRRGLPLTGIAVTVERDAAQERAGVYTLHSRIALAGDLTAAQRQELLGVAAKCPVHKLMTAVTTEITTELDPAPGA